MPEWGVENDNIDDYITIYSGLLDGNWYHKLLLYWVNSELSYTCFEWIFIFILIGYEYYSSYHACIFMRYWSLKYSEFCKEMRYLIKCLYREMYR